MMSTGVLKTCREVKKMYTKKRIVRQVGYLQALNGDAYLLTPWSRVLLDKLTVNFAASQEILRIYGTRKFLTVPTSARHPSKFYGCLILPLETLSPGDPNVGVVYLRIVLSPEEASLHGYFLT
jgi:hypothetical protein